MNLNPWLKSNHKFLKHKFKSQIPPNPPFSIHNHQNLWIWNPSYLAHHLHLQWQQQFLRSPAGNLLILRPTGSPISASLITPTISLFLLGTKLVFHFSIITFHHFKLFCFKLLDSIPKMFCSRLFLPQSKLYLCKLVLCRLLFGFVLKSS